MTVSRDNSKAVYQGIKDAGIRFISGAAGDLAGLPAATGRRRPGDDAGRGGQGRRGHRHRRWRLLRRASPTRCSCRITASWPASTALCRWRCSTASRSYADRASRALGASRTRGTRRAASSPSRCCGRWASRLITRATRPKSASRSKRPDLRLSLALAGGPAAHARSDGGLTACAASHASAPMKRADCIEAPSTPNCDDRLVVTIMGACAQELYDLGHRETSSISNTPWGWPPPSGWGWR